MLPPPQVIKIDVEGAEIEVIRGAARTIEESRPVIVFEADVNMQRFGYGLDDLLEEIRLHGDWRFFGITPSERVPLDDARARGEVNDVLAVPR